jgi:tungstate transport system ATP-binding protein
LSVEGEGHEPVLAAEGLVARRGEATVLDVPSLAVGPREILAVVGPNGAGKSTLLRVLGLLERPAQGTIRLRGATVVPGGPTLRWRRRMAAAFQDPLLCDTTVAANVALGLRLRGARAAAAHGRVRAWLDRLGIAHLAPRPARTLSGGEAQRVSLARALVLDPEILFLDEPFSSLDPPAREGLIADLERILREGGTTTVFVTHDRQEALRLGDRIAVLMGGRIAQLDRPEVVFAAPASEEVARFMGIETILPGRVLARLDGLTVVDVSGATVEVVGDVPEGAPVLVCLRPEDVTLARHAGPPPATTARNRIAGRVARLTALGPQVRVRVEGPVTLTALITRQSREDLGLAPGDPVVATFKASAAHLLRR